MRKQDKQNRLKASVLALALAALPLGAYAAGLGKLTVVSALGQPLRAEIEVTASREEYSSLAARLASPTAFKSAGIEYAAVLSSVRFTLDRRPDGRPYLQVVSDRPINEPFVDMLVEVNWASGRLVREYTFLLDPPDVFRKPAAPAPVAVPEAKPEPVPAPAAAAPQPVEAVRPAPAVVEPKPVAEPKPAPRRAAAPAAPAVKPAETSREVKKGDTLAKIAGEVRPAGVNLDQMLVALFRSNEDAFIGGNMNRLRAGKILSIPDREAVAGVEAKEARAVVVAQAADFNAYRQKLAGVAATAPAREEAPKQLATGKITPRVEDKVPAPPAGADKLEVSRAENGKPGASGKGRAEEDLVAREKALKEANSRIAELEKNINDLKRLAEMRSAAGSKLQEQAQAAKPAAPAAAPAAAQPPAAKPETPPAKPAAPAKPVEAPAPTPVPAPAEVAPPPAAKPAPKPVTPPSPPPPPPSFVDDNPELVFGGAGILALLLGYLGYNAWRRKRTAAAGTAMTADAAASVFGTTGGRSVDTGEDMLPTDFSQDAGGDLAGEEGVDPLAEADVYIAYGRDTQAEEILLEALKKEPARAAIHLKLLEIYAARKSLPPFQTVARDLYGLTAGIGADWEKAAALGRALDPSNPLYGGTAPAAVSASAEEAPADATQIMPAGMAQMAAAQEEAETPAFVDITPPAPIAPPAEDAFIPTPAEETSSSLDFDLDLGELPAEAFAEEAQPAAAEPAPEEVMSLDFDLDLGAPAEAPAASAETPVGTGSVVDFDLDAGAPLEAPAVELPATPADAGNSMDFDLDLGSLPAAEAPAEAAAPVDAGNAMDFDLELPSAEAEAPAAAGLDIPAVETGAEPALDFDLGSAEADAEVTAPPLDLSAINLDLGEPAAAAPAAEPPLDAAMPSLEPAADNPEVATKLELAHAYEEMGDKEGARELLNEVLAEGSPAQQQAARDKLAQLA